MKIKRSVLIVLFALTVCFIWGNSILSKELSARLSDEVGKLIAAIFGGGESAGTVGGIGIRKIAHFVEFFALGVVASLLGRSLVQDTKFELLVLAILGFFVPVIDETIQIFTVRGSSVRDVWIDVGGYAAGCAVAYASSVLARRVRESMKNKHKF